MFLHMHIQNNTGGSHHISNAYLHAVEPAVSACVLLCISRSLWHFSTNKGGMSVLLPPHPVTGMMSQQRPLQDGSHDQWGKW